MVEEYEEHMFGQAGGQRRSFRSQGWLGSGMCRKTPPFPPITVGASKKPWFQPVQLKQTVATCKYLCC